MAGKSPFELNDFSLGLNDDPFDPEPRYSTTLENFNLEPDGSLRSRIGSVVEDLTHPQLPSGVQRVGTMINYDNSTKLFFQSAKKVYYRNPSAFATLTGPTGNDVFSTGSTSSNVAVAQWNKQLFITSDAFPRPMKIYKDSGGTYRVNTSGLPALASNPTITPVAGANTYLYSFHYYYTYTVGSQTFEDDGPVTGPITCSAAAAPNVSAIAITNIPVISNGATDNWDTTVITCKIYRSIAAGSTLYYVGQVTNGTTSYNDTTSDTTLQTHVLLYTEDGTLDFDPTPLHKFVHIVNGIGYYGFIKVSSVEYPFRLRQSIPGNPSACPDIFEIDFEDEITGIGSVNSIPIVTCKRHVYRLEGNFDQFGRGGINPVRISDTAGCISHNSICTAEGRMFWAGNDGYYSTDGYTVMKISDRINSRYALMKSEISDTKRIIGKFDETNRRVLWTAQEDSSNSDLETIVALDLRWGIRPHSTFTTWTGDTFRCTAIEFFNNLLYRGDNSGYIYYHDTDLYSDPRVDTTASASAWQEETIIWTYESLSYNYGSSFFRKMPTRILLCARNIGNTSIQIVSVDDDGKRERSLKPIRWRRNFVWGDETFYWGNPDCKWRDLGVIEQYRRFPARGLRVSYQRIRITNAYATVINSDQLGTAVFDPAFRTATLTNASTVDWPSEVVDYYISTEADAYETQYKILSMTSDTLTIVPAGPGIPTGTKKWVIKGYRKNEPLNLQGYVVHVANVDKNQITYHSGDDGSNV